MLRDMVNYDDLFLNTVVLYCSLKNNSIIVVYSVIKVKGLNYSKKTTYKQSFFLILFLK